MCFLQADNGIKLLLSDDIETICYHGSSEYIIVSSCQMTNENRKSRLAYLYIEFILVHIFLMMSNSLLRHARLLYLKLFFSLLHSSVRIPVDPPYCFLLTLVRRNSSVSGKYVSKL